MSHFWQNHSWNHSLFECLLFDFLLQIYRRWSCFQYQTAVIAWSMSCFASHHEISMTSWNLLQHIWHWCHGVTSEISSTTNMPWIAIVKETSWVQLLQHQKSWTSIIKKNKASQKSILRKRIWMIHDVSQPSKKYHGFVWKLDILTMVDHHVFQEHGNLLGLPPFLDKPTARMYSNHHEPSHWQMW